MIHRHTTTYGVDLRIVLAELSLVLDYGFQKRELVTNLEKVSLIISLITILCSVKISTQNSQRLRPYTKGHGVKIVK